MCLIVLLTRLNCVGGSSDAGSDVNSSATNWQPNTGARTHTHICMHTTPFCAYVFNLIFVNFSNNNNTFALPVFGYFKLVRLLCYIFCLFYVCLRRHTHTQAFSGTHTDTAAASVRFAAGILRAFCSCAAPATRLLQRQTEAAAATPATTTTTTCTCCHCVVLLSLVPII